MELVDEMTELMKELLILFDYWTLHSPSLALLP